MAHRFSRTELLIGSRGLEKLKTSRVAVFGIGGVGSYAVEALARSGIGHLMVVDHDLICETNINRQIHALESTIGRLKTDVMKERINQINPEASIVVINKKYSPGGSEMFNLESYDYIVDAIDDVRAKVDLIHQCLLKGVNIISAMGAGNKLDPVLFEVDDISKTSVCPLARIVRRELRKLGVNQGVKVVYSKEKPVNIELSEEANEYSSKKVSGSISFVPSVMGLIIAGVVVNDLLKN